jgi:nitrite reductase/ring-hydroxylating ferredoxin subunit
MQKRMGVADVHEDGCSSCPVANAMARRAFFRESAARALAAVGAVALLPVNGAAMSFRFVSGSGPRTAKIYPIPAVDGVSIDKGESVIIARFRDRVYAFSLACPHQNTALRWDERNNRFQCPKHRSRYHPDGVFIEGRATRGMDRFAVSRSGTAEMQVDLDALYRQDEHRAEWDAAFLQLAAPEA